MCCMQGIALMDRTVLPGLSVGNNTDGTSSTYSHIIVEIQEAGGDLKNIVL